MARLARIVGEYLLAFLLIASLLLAIAGVVVVKFYGDDLQEYVIQEVNDRVDTKVYLDEAQVKVFRRFPNTSILLKNVVVWSSHNFNARAFEGGADTLLTAESVSVSFNLLGLIRKKYNIRQLEINRGDLRLLTDPQGEANYQVTSGERKGDSGRNQINLSQLKVNDFRVLIDNRVKQLTGSGQVELMELNGKFARRNSQIRTSLKGSLDSVSNKGILYASDRDIRARLNLDVVDTSYMIRAGQLQIDRIVADMEGSFTPDPGNGVNLDLQATARNLNIHEVLDLLPSEMSNPLREIRGNGILQLDATIKGKASSTLTPFIEAGFLTSNANLSWNRVPFTLKDLELSGSYSNGGAFNPVSTSLNIESISAVIGRDRISGSGAITNFYDPDFSFYLKGDLHPGQWLRWYESIPLEDASGTVYSDLTVTGSYNRLNPPGERFISFDLSGGVSFDEVMVRFHRDTKPLTELNGVVKIEKDFWEPSLSGKLGSSDFSVVGSGLNLLSFLLEDNEDLIVSATFRSDFFDLREILESLPRSGGSERSSRNSRKNNKKVIHFPDRLDLNLDFVMNEFVLDQFEASRVRGVALYDAPYLRVDSLSMQTMDGTLTGNFAMAQDKNLDIFTRVSASLYNLDIQQLFRSFNNFGQVQLTHEHLKGTISGTSSFSARFDSTFTINTPTILSENEVTIRDGALKEFQPILALSRFIDVEELENIQFSTLENTILIRENLVVIPVMVIRSNALDLSASGTHGFDNRYDYRIRLLLSDLLYNKASRSGNSEFEIAADESDTRTLFLKIVDEGSGANVQVDREKTAEKIRSDLREEKSELKRILNRELGLFKKDRDVTGEEEEKKEELFKFEFPDEVDTVKEEKQPGRFGRRFRKRTKVDTSENKPVRRFVIDENP